MLQCLKQEPLAHHPINMRRKMKKRRKNEGALKSCWGKMAFPARLVAPTLRRARTMGCFWEGRGAEIFEQCTDLTWYIRLIEHRLPDGTLLASAWMCISQGHLFSWPQMMLCARKDPTQTSSMVYDPYFCSYYNSTSHPPSFPKNGLWTIKTAQSGKSESLYEPLSSLMHAAYMALN